MKMIPKKAMIDADIIAYKAACYLDTEGLDELESRLSDDVLKWTPDGVDTIVLALSCSRKNNFRRDFWGDYKKKRDSQDSPDSLNEVREYMLDTWDCLTEPRLEADDLIGIGVSSEEYVGVTIDKDLKTIPGYHWNPDKDDDIRYISEEDADRFFYTQWMTGDSTDGIPGLWRIGPKKAEKLLDSWDKNEWEENIIDMYNEDKYQPEHSLAPNLFAMAMARSVRILRDGEYNFETQEIKLWKPMVGSNNSKEI